MTETPVPRLVIGLAVPTTISMLITNIYNAADTFFVSKISVSASGATGIVFSLMAIFQALGFMCGHGAGANLSRLLGAKDGKGATTYTTTGFFMAMLLGLLAGSLGLAFKTPLMRLLGSTETILPEAEAYGFWILLSAPAMTCSCVLNNVLRYEGRATFAMFGLTAGGILNMLLDPLFIFALNMGTGGAGLSTALSQYVSLAILLLPFFRGQTSSKIRPSALREGIKLCGNIAATGTPNLLRQGLNSVSMALLNIKASVFGDAAIAAISIATRVVNLLFSGAIGLAQGFQPVSSFNYGARKYDRVRRAYRFTLITNIVAMAVLAGGCAAFAPRVIALFRNDEEIISIGSRALRLLCASLPFLPCSAMGSMQFQCTGEKKKAALVSSLQSGLIMIPLLLVLPELYGLNGLELCMPVSYVAAALTALPMSIIHLKQLGRESADQQKRKTGGI